MPESLHIQRFRHFLAVCLIDFGIRSYECFFKKSPLCWSRLNT